jgi:hypothetical protein
MISKRTVMVLGAGASYPYGFPTGLQLLHDVCEGLDPHSGATKTRDLRPYLLECGFKPDRLAAFREALQLSHQPSVDAFLEVPVSRREFLDVGMTAIAVALMLHEDQGEIRRKRSPRWFEHVFKHMQVTGADFRSNQLSIVTFNYDRSVEQLFYNALTSSYGMDAIGVAEVLREIRVVHVYGKLGNLHWQSSDGRPYEPLVNRETVRKCVTSMKVMAQGERNSEEFATARRLLRNAECICFLGFGYLDTNLERLFDRDEEFGRLAILPEARIYGSTKGLGRVRMAQVTRQLTVSAELPDIGLVEPELGSSTEVCLEFLREHVSLR